MAELSGKDTLKRTAKHSAIYAVGTVLRRITSFVMLPIYTRYLTPADYGTVELLSMAIEIAGVLVGLRISQALFRYYVMEEEKKQKNIIVSTVLFTVLGGSSIGVGILYLFAEPLSVALFGHAGYSTEVRLFSFVLLLNAVHAVCLSYLRVRQKPVLFIAINIASLVIQVLSNVVFVVLLELHVIGVIYSALVSGGIIAFFLFIYTTVNVGVRYSWETAKELIIYTMPLMVGAIGAIYVAYADKYFLRVFGSLADVGLYALAFRLSSVVSIVFDAFNMSWGVERFAVVKQDNAREIYDQVFRYLSAVLFIGGCGLALFAGDLLWVMTTPDFYGAAAIVPILVLSVIVRLFTIFNNFGILLSKRTRHLAESAWLKAVVATIACISLIPILGVYGAAIAMVISNLAEFGWVYARSKRLYDMGLRWWPVNIMGLAATAYALVGISLPDRELEYFFVRVGLFIAMVISVYKLPIWSDSERMLMTGLVRKYVNVKSFRDLITRSNKDA